MGEAVNVIGDMKHVDVCDTARYTLCPFPNRPIGITRISPLAPLLTSANEHVLSRRHEA